MLIPFIKMQAQGNDFVIWTSSAVPDRTVDLSHLARHICNRHFGVGADGLVILTTEDIADQPKMQIYNADGSRAKMCGSALRCCTAILAEHSDKTQFLVQTDSGTKRSRILSGGSQPLIESEIGSPRILQDSLSVQGFIGTLVDAGNLHFIIQTTDTDDQSLLHVASLIQLDPILPPATNVHFVRHVSETEIDLLIWEHGVGATLACGTGAASAVHVGIQTAKLQTKVKVNMPGGSVYVRSDIDTGDIWLAGTVEKVFTGEYEWKT